MFSITLLISSQIMLIKEDGMNTFEELLLAEFFTATGYLDRLLFVFIELENLHFTTRGKKQIPKLLNDLQTFLGMRLNQFELSHNVENLEDDTTTGIATKETREKISLLKNYHTYMEAFLKLPLLGQKKNQMAIQYINLIYRHCYEIHNFIIDSTSTDVPLPRVLLGQSQSVTAIRQNLKKEHAPIFSIDEEKLTKYLQAHQAANTLSFLNLKRQEKYELYLSKGHVFVSQKRFAEAKDSFLKARNYQETAEVLTLIAWAYSLLNQIEEAKQYCIKAMKTDDKYGPAYNDFGNILLSQGQVNEGLRWFELAKRAPNYQNREFPYINAGRAYIMLKKYPEALQEFTLALAIAPEHQELHETINKIKGQFLKNEYAQGFKGEFKEDNLT